MVAAGLTLVRAAEGVCLVRSVKVPDESRTVGPGAVGRTRLHSGIVAKETDGFGSATLVFHLARLGCVVVMCGVLASKQYCLR